MVRICRAASACTSSRSQLIRGCAVPEAIPGCDCPPGPTVRFWGRVCPEHVGASLAIQRRTAPKRWRTVRRTTLADLPGSRCSSYARRLRVRRSGARRSCVFGCCHRRGRRVPLGTCGRRGRLRSGHAMGNAPPFSESPLMARSFGPSGKSGRPVPGAGTCNPKGSSTDAVGVSPERVRRRTDPNLRRAPQLCA
jgi:hypothetical protein